MTHIREREPIQGWIIEVGHLPASQAHQVVVGPRIGVEARLGPEVAGPARHPDPDEGLQDPIHRSARHSWKTGLHVIEDLVRRRMILTTKQRLQDRLPLHGQWDPVLSTELFEVCDLFASCSHMIIFLK